MKSIRDWVFAQLESGSLVLPRPLLSSNGCFEEGPQNKELASSGLSQSAEMEPSQSSTDVMPTSSGNQEGQTVTRSQQVLVEDPPCHDSTDRKKSDPLSKIEALQIKFFRILQRLGQSPEDILVAKVLYRIHLATLISARESDLKRINLRSDKARNLAAEQEAAGRPVLDFSLRIIVLGRTGVGKSATVNSLFNQKRVITNAFRPATDQIEEVAGIVNGIKMTVIDTPGFWPSSPSNIRRNRKIMYAIRRYIRKSPPDVVLYVERLDNLRKGYSDFPLLRLVTEVFGPAMWFNTILVTTHSASILPEGPNGYTVGYDSYVSNCTDLLQRYVQLAVSDAKLENPVVLAENHPKCRTNIIGEKILPNGQIWRRELLFLCMCTKVLGDANVLLGLQGSIELGPSSNTRLPSLPNLLSSFLLQCPLMKPDGTENEFDEFSLLDDEDEEEYDQLPPIRILTKSQFQRLSQSQKKEYLDELDYRETLFLKKQLKEELRRRRQRKSPEDQRSDNGDNPEAEVPEAVPLPDMAVPPSFDSDYPVHRYRGVVTSDQWLWRPVLDPHGWDHDVGFNGVNLETAVEIKRNLTVTVAGQMSKDKHDFSIHSQNAVAYADPQGLTYSAGLDVQSSGNDMIYTVHSHAKLGNMKHNVPGCGVSVMSFQKKYYVGMKLEDTLLVGKRLKFVMNAGRMGGGGQAAAAAYGGSLEATIRGRDYPVRNDKLSVALTALSLNKELVLSGSIETEFRPKRGMRVSVNANLNTQKMGQVSIKTASSEHLQIALIAFFTIFRAICRRREPNSLVGGAQEME